MYFTWMGTAHTITGHGADGKRAAAPRCRKVIPLEVVMPQHTGLTQGWCVTYVLL